VVSNAHMTVQPTCADPRSQVNPGHPRISVCVPTRNRGSAIAPTLRSLARLQHGDFHVLVVDQSVDAITKETFREVVGSDRRFTYLPTETVGASVARNVATERAEGAIIIFTDDDCVVPPDWLGEIERAFGEHPEAGMICGTVSAGEHDTRLGSVPAFMPSRTRLFRSPWTKYRARGIGANFAFRAAALHLVGDFDVMLGAGAPLKSCEDGDMVYRFLRAGEAVLDRPESAVVHNGFRTWSEGRTLGRDALMACGATCMKHLRLGDLAIVPTLGFLWFRRTIRWGNLLRLRRPFGVALFFEFARGMIISFRYPVDRATRCYRAPSGGTAALSLQSALRRARRRARGSGTGE